VTAPIPLLTKLLPAGQCPNSADLDLIEGTNTGLERPAKGWINRFSVIENQTQTSSPPLLTTARPLETVSEQQASTGRPSRAIMSALPSRQRPRRRPRPKPHWSMSRPIELRRRIRQVLMPVTRIEGPAVMIATHSRTRHAVKPHERS
jgi:hypothetical protein